jgi:hypothetical protein
MTNYQVEERAKLKKQWVDQAIALAMQNKWEEAVTANQRILEQVSNDVDALNRLGRALTELGRYADAREAYTRAVSIDKLNVIAKRNLARLASMGTEAVPAKVGQRVDPRFFIEETGKTGITPITRTAGRKTLATLTTGDQVDLEVQGRALFVHSSRGEIIGQVEPKLAQRLIDLMNGGNRYAAAIMSVDEDSARVLIRETYQAPSQTGKVSFPTRGEATGVRPYIKGTLIRYESEDEEEEEEGEIEAEIDAEEADEPGESAELEEEHSPE